MSRLERRALDSWWSYLQGILSGTTLRASEGDVHPRGEDVLSDPEGVVRIHHVGDGPADRPSVEAILEAMRQG